MAALWSLLPNTIEDLTHLHLLAVLRRRFMMHYVKQVFFKGLFVLTGQFTSYYETTVTIFFIHKVK